MEPGQHVTEATSEAAQELGGKAYLGDQDQGLPPPGQHLGYGPQVNFRLAAARCPVEEEYLEFPAVQGLIYGTERPVLRGGRLVRGRGLSG